MDEGFSQEIFIFAELDQGNEVQILQQIPKDICMNDMNSLQAIQCIKKDIKDVFNVFNQNISEFENDYSIFNNDLQLITQLSEDNSYQCIYNVSNCPDFHSQNYQRQICTVFISQNQQKILRYNEQLQFGISQILLCLKFFLVNQYRIDSYKQFQILQMLILDDQDEITIKERLNEAFSILNDHVSIIIKQLPVILLLENSKILVDDLLFLNITDLDKIDMTKDMIEQLYLRVKIRSITEILLQHNIQLIKHQLQQVFNYYSQSINDLESLDTQIQIYIQNLYLENKTQQITFGPFVYYVEQNDVLFMLLYNKDIKDYNRLFMHQIEQFNIKEQFQQQNNIKCYQNQIYLKLPINTEIIQDLRLYQILPFVDQLKMPLLLLSESPIIIQQLIRLKQILPDRIFKTLITILLQGTQIDIASDSAIFLNIFFESMQLFIPTCSKNQKFQQINILEHIPKQPKQSTLIVSFETKKVSLYGNYQISKFSDDFCKIQTQDDIKGFIYQLDLLLCNLVAESKFLNQKSDVDKKVQENICNILNKKSEKRISSIKKNTIQDKIVIDELNIKYFMNK